LQTEGHHSQTNKGWRIALPGIVLLALLLRLPGILAHPVLLTESTTYARISANLLAGHGYVGIIGEPDWFVPPFYPLLMAGIGWIMGGDTALAGRLISLLLGSLLTLPVYALARDMYGRQAGAWAALLVALHPLLMLYGSLAWSETTYAFLIACGLALLWSVLHRMIRDGTAIAQGARSVETGPKTGLRTSFLENETFTAFVVGVCFGLAYLTRNEGAIYAALTAALVMLVAALIAWQRGRVDPASSLVSGTFRRGLLLTMAVTVGFLLLFLPYVTFISRQLGRLTLETKSRANFIITARMAAGMSYVDAAYGLEPDGSPAGPFLDRPAVLRGEWPDPPHVPLSARLRLLVAGLRQERAEFSLYLLSPLLLILIGFGAVAGSWQAEELVQRAPTLLTTLLLAFVVPRALLPAVGIGWLLGFGPLLRRNGWGRLAFLGVFLLASVLIIALVPQIYTRYLMPLLLLLLVWAGAGLAAIERWATRWWKKETDQWRVQVLSLAVTLTVLAAVITSLPRENAVTYRRRADVDQQRAGAWLAAYDPDPNKRIMSAHSQLPYYAQGVHIPLPNGTSEQVLHYAQMRQVDYLAIEPRKLRSRPGLASWATGTRLPSPWMPIYRDPNASGGELIIYAKAGATSNEKPATNNQ